MLEDLLTTSFRRPAKARRKEGCGITAATFVAMMEQRVVDCTVGGNLAKRAKK